MTLPAPSARPDEIVREKQRILRVVRELVDELEMLWEQEAQQIDRDRIDALLACADAYGREEEERRLRAATTEPGTVADPRDDQKAGSNL